MKNTKLMTALMAGTMIAGSVMPVFAESVEMNPSGTQDAAVTYDSTPKLDSTDAYSVKIPKTIDMGNKKTATYEVGVAGEMKEVSITITPATSFEMIKAADNTQKVTATVTQADTDWAPEELKGTMTKTSESETTVSYTIDHYEMHQGTISAEDLTDGVWNGTLTFTIGIK